MLYIHPFCLQASSALVAGSMSGPLSGDSFGSASLSKKASQLAEQLQRGNPMDRITAARRLLKVATKDSKVSVNPFHARCITVIALITPKGLIGRG